MRLLLFDNNQDSSVDVGKVLESLGNTVEYANGEIHGLQLASSDGYDAVLLGLSVPGSDGLMLCRRLRASARPDIPIMMLGRCDSEADKLRGFDAGADDYLTEPISPRELHARLKALARRAPGFGQILQVADLTFNPRALLIQRDSRPRTLTRTGMRILEYLMRASPGVVTREQIERTVWGDDPPGSDAAIRGHILMIRNAIDSESEPKLLHTVHGIGYRLGIRCLSKPTLLIGCIEAPPSGPPALKS
jgi:DNA-binding response OmpR family regulator